MIITTPCRKCTHYEVCKYREAYEAAHEKLSELVTDTYGSYFNKKVVKQQTEVDLMDLSFNCVLYVRDKTLRNLNSQDSQSL